MSPLIYPAKSILVKQIINNHQQSFDEIKPSTLKFKLINSKYLIRYRNDDHKNEYEYVSTSENNHKTISKPILMNNTIYNENNYIIEADRIYLNKDKASSSINNIKEYEFLHIVLYNSQDVNDCNNLFNNSMNMNCIGNSSSKIIIKNPISISISISATHDRENNTKYTDIDIIMLITEETQVIIDQYPIYTKYSYEEMVCISRPLNGLIDNCIEFNTYKFYNKSSIESEVCDRVPVVSLLGVTSMAYRKQLHTSFLICGDTNTGKTTLVHGIADRYNMQVVQLTICDLIQSGREYADKKLVEVCNMVIALQSPCILVIDDIDSLLLSDTDTDTIIPNTNTTTNGDQQEIGGLILEKLGELIGYFNSMNQRYEVNNGSSSHSTGGGVQVQDQVHPYIWLFGVMHVADSENDKNIWLTSTKVRSLFPERDQIIHLSGTYPSTPYERRSVISNTIRHVGEYCSRYRASDYEALTNLLVSIVEDEGGLDLDLDMDLDHVMRTGIAFVIYCYALLHKMVVLHGASRFMSTFGILDNININIDTDSLVTTSNRNMRNADMSLFSNNIDVDVVSSTSTSASASMVYGHSAIKDQLYDAILLPKLFYNTFRKYRCKLEIGVLLYGPPGTGKTLLTRSLALQSNYAFLSVRLTDVIKGEVGTGEHILLDLFKSAKRSVKPTIIFIDEFQSLFTAKQNASGEDTTSSLTSSLMSCLDEVVVWNTYAGSKNLITVIAATNEPWAIDASFLRPGRFDRCIYVGTLDSLARRRMLINSYRGSYNVDTDGRNVPMDVMSLPLTEFEVNFLVDATDGFTGADIDNLIRKSKILAVNEILHPKRKSKGVDRGSQEDSEAKPIFDFSLNSIETITTNEHTCVNNTNIVGADTDGDKPPIVCYRHWISAMQCVTPSVSLQDVEVYKEWKIEMHTSQ